MLLDEQPSQQVVAAAHRTRIDLIMSR